MKPSSLGRTGHVEIDDDPSKDLRASVDHWRCLHKEIRHHSCDNPATVFQTPENSNRCKQNID